MNILGLNGVYTHDSSAVIISGGEVLAAVEEERFTHEKHTSDFPTNSIEFCLSEAKISDEDVDVIAVPFDIDVRMRNALAYTASNLDERARLSQLIELTDHQRIDDLLKAIEVERRFLFASKQFYRFAEERFPRAKLRFYRHHHCHAASTYFVSGYGSESLVFVADLVGEWDSTSLYVGSQTGISKLNSICFPVSFGKIYNLFTEFLGFRSHSDEYKVMGLAAYGQDRYRDFFDKLFVREDGHLRAGESFAALTYHLGLKPGWTSVLNGLLGPERTVGEELSQRHADIANSLQSWLERMVLQEISLALQQNGLDTICLAGGVCLNAVLNQKILELEAVKSVFVQPASHDAGTSLGAALLALREDDPNSTMKQFENYYLGPHCGSKWPEEAKFSGFEKTEGEPDPKRIAELLSAGKIVAICRGRAEFGPRALGNRSILAMASSTDVRDRVNRLIKKREDFRPFAPVVLERFASSYFLGLGVSPYMTMTYGATEKAKRDIPAAVHVDGTARVQTVNDQQNPFLHKVLTEFYQISDVPALLNTSLNIAGDTMALTIEDAWATFIDCEIDAIVSDMGMYVR